LVDFGGPFITIQGRRTRRQKRYLCLLACFVTREVHLEMAYSLDADSTPNALFRMANQIFPEKCYLKMVVTSSESTEKWANWLKCLTRTGSVHQQRPKVLSSTSNPPLGPHFGDMHETMIKVTKQAVEAILGNADTTKKELATAFRGAEALLNSRPLTCQSANPDDDVPLTPNHFLMGQTGGQFAPESVDETAYSPEK